MKRSGRILAFVDGVPEANISDLYDPSIEVTLVDNGSRQQLLQRIGDYEGYITTLRIRVDQEVIAQGRRLRLVATPSTGLDHLALDVLAQRGIAVQSLKTEDELLEQITATAELTLGLILTCARHLPHCFEASRRGEWKRSRLAGMQLSGKVLGIVGVGRLGTMVARYGHAMGMKVLGCDPHPKVRMPGVEYLDLNGLLQQSDIVSLHLHLAPETRHLLGRREFARMKSGATLINTARGGLIDENALIEAMENGRVSAAGLDVIDGEWEESLAKHPLLVYSRTNPHLYITPHVGGTCPEARLLAVRHTVRRAVDYLRRIEGTLPSGDSG